MSKARQYGRKVVTDDKYHSIGIICYILIRREVINAEQYILYQAELSSRAFTWPCVYILPSRNAIPRVMKSSTTDLIVVTNICPVHQPCINLFSAIYFYERNEKQKKKILTFQNLPPFYLQGHGNDRKRDY